MALLTLTKACGTQKIPGTKTTLFIALTPEITAFPQTEAELGGTDQGDTKLLNEPFDFSGAATGLGYWRSCPVLVNTGNVRNTKEGEIGGSKSVQRLDVFIPDNSDSAREFIDCLIANDGCLIPGIEDKGGIFHVLGDLENPAYVEASEGGTGGDRVGYAVTFYADNGLTNYSYDAATHGIDTTPNV